MTAAPTDSLRPAGQGRPDGGRPPAPWLTLVIPAADSPPTLSRCLEHVHAARRPPEQVVVVEGPPRSGPAAARNRGAMDATGEILVFVDADVCVHPDAFERIRARFAEDPSLAAVFGSYDDRPAAEGMVSAFRNLLHHHVHQSNGGPATTFWAGLGAIRRAAFERVGGFDAERCPRFVEDVELGMRLAGSGARIELDPLILGTHLKPWTLLTMLRTDLRGRAVPWLGLLLDQRRLPAALNLAWRHRLSALASAVATAGVLARRPRWTGTGGGVLLALNADFYRLLLRRRGPFEAVAGVGLHALHHLAAITALALALPRAVWRWIAAERVGAPAPAKRLAAPAGPATGPEGQRATSAGALAHARA